jgi:glycosyltransferase involved in cell wall biosynthesis
LGIKPGEKVITSISRFVPKNGIKNLVKAFGFFSNSNIHPLKLLLIGEGEQRTELENLVSYLKIKDKVIFTGQVNYQELPKYLKISDIFVRPSLSEGLGNSFIEAMAASVPIVGSKVGGIPDFLTDFKTGLFCNPKNPEDIAEKIRIILSDETLRKGMIDNAFQMVRERYDWSRIAKKYNDIYQN